jgi:hypothetical protein
LGQGPLPNSRGAVGGGGVGENWPPIEPLLPHAHASAQKNWTQKLPKDLARNGWERSALEESSRR